MNYKIIFFLLLFINTTLFGQDEIANNSVSEAVFYSLFKSTPELEEEKESRKNEQIQAIILSSNDSKVENIDNLTGIHIENLCLPSSLEKLQKYLQPYLGNLITLKQIECIKASILNYYQENAHPFVIVSTPEQKITNGIIKFIINESRVSKIEIKGNQYFDTSVLDNFISLKKGDKIDTNKIVQDLYWMNKNPFRSASVLFQTGEEELTTNIDYIVQDRRTFRVYAGTDNTGFDTTGKNRIYTGFNWGNVWNLDHILTFQYTTSSKFHRFRSFTGSYALPFLGKHLITAYGGYSQFKPSVAISDLHNRGHSYQASLRYTHPLEPFGHRFVQDFSIGFDVKGTDTNLTYRQEPILGKTSLITQLAFTYVLNYETSDIRLPFQLDCFFAPGNIFPHQKNTDFSSLRYRARSRYFYAHLTYSPYFKLPHNMYLLFNIQAQASTTNLLSSEQFGLGGYNTIRGYEYREVNKDNGLITSVELVSAPWKILRQFSEKIDLKFLAFIDYGIGWDHKKTPEIEDSEYLLGIGPGLRLTISQYLAMRLDWGYKLHKTAFEPNAHHSRWHFGITANY